MAVKRQLMDVEKILPYYSFTCKINLYETVRNINQR
jgi:hypothetical protein